MDRNMLLILLAITAFGVVYSLEWIMLSALAILIALLLAERLSQPSYAPAGEGHGVAAQVEEAFQQPVVIQQGQQAVAYNFITELVNNVIQEEGFQKKRAKATEEAITHAIEKEAKDTRKSFADALSKAMKKDDDKKGGGHGGGGHGAGHGGGHH